MGLKTLSQAAKTCSAYIYAAGEKLWRLASATWNDLSDQEIQTHIGSVGYSLKKKKSYFYIYDKKPEL